MLEVSIRLEDWKNWEQKIVNLVTNWHYTLHSICRYGISSRKKVWLETLTNDCMLTNGDRQILQATLSIRTVTAIVSVIWSSRTPGIFWECCLFWFWATVYYCFASDEASRLVESDFVPFRKANCFGTLARLVLTRDITSRAIERYTYRDGIRVSILPVRVIHNSRWEARKFRRLLKYLIGLSRQFRVN